MFEGRSRALGGYHNLDEESCEQYERLYRDSFGRREFFELFGPELLLPEHDFFTGAFLKTEVHTSDKVVRKAKEVAAELRPWLVERGYLTSSRLKELDESVKVCERLKRRLRPILRRLGRSLVEVDASMLAEERLRLFRLAPRRPGRTAPGLVSRASGASPEEIGPVTVPEEITRHLRRGFHARLRSRAAPGPLAVGRIFGGPPSGIAPSRHKDLLDHARPLRPS